MPFKWVRLLSVGIVVRCDVVAETVLRTPFELRMAETMADLLACGQSEGMVLLGGSSGFRNGDNASDIYWDVYVARELCLKGVWRAVVEGEGQSRAMVTQRIQESYICTAVDD